MMNAITKNSDEGVTGFNKVKIAYYGFTGLLSLMTLFSAGMYVFNHAAIEQAFTALGYPTYIIYPLATAKILGLVAIWTRMSHTLLNLAYAGFMYNFILAFSAHIMVGDGEFPGALMALCLLAGSYFSQKKLFS